MSRIPTHTINDAPQASRPLLANVIQFSPTGRPLNLHGQMAHSPAVLVAYTSLRAATAQHGTVGPRLSAALMLAAGSAVGNADVVAIAGLVREAAVNSGKVSDATWGRAVDAGWTDEQLTEAFAYLGLIVFTAYFLNYAQTDLDVPVTA